MRKVQVKNSDRCLIVDEQDWHKVKNLSWSRVGDDFMAMHEGSVRSLGFVLGLGRVRVKNGDVFDRRRENLEIVPRQKTSRYKGIHRSGNAWFITIGRQKLGPFPSEEQALAVRRGAGG